MILNLNVYGLIFMIDIKLQDSYFRTDFTFANVQHNKNDEPRF